MDNDKFGRNESRKIINEKVRKLQATDNALTYSRKRKKNV